MMKYIIKILLILLSSCTKIIDSTPVRDTKVICKQCITQTDWYPEMRTTYDTCIICGDDTLLYNGWGRTYAAPDLSWRIHKWTVCK